MAAQAGWQVVLMGVSGTGKSTVGAALSERLGIEYVDGDEYHSQPSIGKMSAGVPLDDEDRRPWLATLAGILGDRAAVGVPTLMGCSALKRSYRDLLRGSGGEVRFLHLVAPYDVLLRRMREREHYMPPDLLRSQFDTLEPLDADEAGWVVDVDRPLRVIVEEAVRLLS